MLKADSVKRPRLVVAVAVLAGMGVVLIWSSARAAGAEYSVLKCFAGVNRDAHDSEILPSIEGNYQVKNQCGPGDPWHRLAIDNTRAALYGHHGAFTISAPTGTLIDRVWFQSNLAQRNGHFAQVIAINPYSQRVLRQGTSGGEFGYASTYADQLGHMQLQLRVICFAPTCGSSGSAAHAYVRNIHIVLRDGSPPQIRSVGGSLVSGGWIRGFKDLSATATDVGGGLEFLRVGVNGAWIGPAAGACPGAIDGQNARRLAPCHGGANLRFPVDTSRHPFRNGVNTMQVFTYDFAGNRTNSRVFQIRVDNLRPTIAFLNQDPNDPELIRARVGDDHSGVAGAKLFYRPRGATEWKPLETQVQGQLAQARVDSLSHPPGEYEFLASATDLAGNWALSKTREDGSEMSLTFPLKTAVELRAHLNRGGSKGQIVRYGTDAKAKGRLLDAYGNPLAGQPVTIVEHFGSGALLRERVSHAITDEKGKWRSKLPSGPSREVRASYSGTRKYQPDERGAGVFVVRSRASFKTSRRNVSEGKAVIFRGKVRHRGARIPSGGKLVELQVRMKPGRWDTIGEAFRTRANGRYRRRYRFGRHYAADALFRFRVKVKREARWPYRRTTTRRRQVIVRAH